MFTVYPERYAGSPRQGELYDMMRSTRARSKLAIRYLKRHEATLRSDILARKLMDSSPRKFWDEIKKMNNSNTPLPKNVDGVNGQYNIANMWKSHYQSLFNCLQTTKSVNYVVDSDPVPCVTADDIRYFVYKMDNDKSNGIDGLYAENLKYASPRLFVLLAMCISGMFVHCFLPESMLNVILVPVIKDKAKKLAVLTIKDQ